MRLSAKIDSVNSDVGETEKRINAAYDAAKENASNALAGSTTKIPLLYTAVTDPDGSGISGKNVTGTSDMAPIARQIDLVKTVSPDCRKIALVYHASEENSEKQIKIAEERCAAIGLATKKYAIPDVNSITTTASEIRNAGDIDAVYVPTDNMLASNIAAFCDELYGDKNSTAKIPVIAGEDGLCEDGEALATLGISYYELGVQTAGMAIKLLCGESPENIAVAFQRISDLYKPNAGRDAFQIPDNDTTDLYRYVVRARRVQ